VAQMFVECAPVFSIVMYEPVNCRVANGLARLASGCGAQSSGDLIWAPVFSQSGKYLLLELSQHFFRDPAYGGLPRFCNGVGSAAVIARLGFRIAPDFTTYRRWAPL
jgi:hypothetical protein